MKRKVVLHGNSTLTVSIPTKWAKVNNILKGDELNVEEKGKSLSITSQKERAGKRKSINISQFLYSGIARKIVHGLYKRGYKEIELKFNDTKTLLRIQKELPESMIGYDIIEQGKDYCRIRDLAHLRENEFDLMFNRTLHLLKSTSEGLVEAIEKKDIELIRSLFVLAKLNKKTTGFCRRVINLSGYENPELSCMMYCIIEFLSRMADEYEKLFNYFIENGINVDRETSFLFKKLDELVQDTCNQFKKYDLNQVTSLFEKREELNNRAIKLLETKNSVPIHYAISMVQVLDNILTIKIQVEL